MARRSVTVAPWCKCTSSNVSSRYAFDRPEHQRGRRHQAHINDGYTCRRAFDDDLRRQTIARVLDMPMAARIRLALSLGDDDLALFARTSGLTREEARRRLRQQRDAGRTISRAAASGDL